MTRTNNHSSVDIFSKAITRQEFNEGLEGRKDANKKRLFDKLGFIGIGRYADLMAMGSDLLVERSRRSDDVYFWIGNNSLKRLQAVVTSVTGSNLPVKPATPHELLGYYDEIESAAAALVLPRQTLMRDYNYAEIPLTIGDILYTPEEVVPSSVRSVEELILTTERDFITPFYNAKAEALARL